MAGEVVAHPVDQGEVGVAAGCVVADQRPDQMETDELGRNGGRRGGGVHAEFQWATRAVLRQG